MDSLRVIDTGLLSAAQNIAWDRALLKARKDNLIPDTLRFLRFTPSALVGFHQSVEQEIRVDYCERHGIEINRRITGGGSIYFDQGQLGWELVFNRDSLPNAAATMENISTAVCESAAAALRELGVDAQFRPRNDLEVDGRKLSGTGGVFEGNTVLFQGTLLVDFDLEKLIKALRIPVEKLNGKDFHTARSRVVALAELLDITPDTDHIKSLMVRHFSRLLNKPAQYTKPTDLEKSLYIESLQQTLSPEWIRPDGDDAYMDIELVKAVYKCSGGLFRMAARYDINGHRVKQLIITGDFFVSPSRLVFDLEAALKDSPISAIVQRAQEFFDGYRFEAVALDAEDFIAALTKLVEKLLLLDDGYTVSDLNALETVGASIKQISESAQLLLLPYCAKPLDCEYRNEDNCDECGRCDIGEAYAMAREAGMRARCITNYEELVDVLAIERKSGTKAFIGACCGAFFTKRNKAFIDADMPCAIVDINDTTCYELHEEELAYKGQFLRQTTLKMDTLKKALGLSESQVRKKV